MKKNRVRFLNNTFIIAEAGVNHNGLLSIAKKLVEKATWAGADAVKFQTFKAVTLVSPDTPKADYQLKTTDSSETQFEMIKRLAATALGAKVIEKHFTLDNTMEGPDHKASLEPQELKQMVKAIRNIEMALGDGVKKPSPSEKSNIAISRKSIVAAKDIAKGELFSKTNITAKRPGTGISPMLWDDIIGQSASRNFHADELID